MFKRKFFHRGNYIKLAVCGVRPGAGAMHAALTIANYLSSKKKQDVIFIELSATSRIFQLLSDQSLALDSSLGYPYRGVTYVPACSVSQARDILISSRASVVVAIGELDSASDAIFSLCQKQLVIGCMAPWCSESYVSFIRNKLIKFHDIKQISFCGINLNKIEKQTFKRMYDCNIRPMPYIKNPFCLSEKDFPLIDQLLL